MRSPRLCHLLFAVLPPLLAALPSARAEAVLAAWAGWSGGEAWREDGGLLLLSDGGEALLEASGGWLVADEAGAGFYADWQEVRFVLVPGAPPPGAGRVVLVVRGLLPAQGGEPEAVALVRADGTALPPASSERRGDAVRHTWDLDDDARAGRWEIVWRLPPHASFDAVALIAVSGEEEE